MPGSIVEQAKVAVLLDGRDAEQTLQELTSNVNKYTDALTRAYQAGDKNAIKQGLKDLNAAERELKTFKTQAFEVQKVLKDLNGSSFNDLVKAERQLRNEMKALRRDTDAYTKTREDWKKVKAEIDRASGSAKGMSKVMMTLKQALPIVSIGAVVAGAVRLGKELFNLSKTIQGEAIRSSVVFGDQLGYVEAEAEKLAKKMGVTNREFVSMAAATADLLIPLDFTREQAAQMSVELQGLTGALDEWTAGSIGAKEISEILTKAMLGENEQLKQLGIAIRKDTDEYRDLVKQKIETTGATKAQAEAMATLELIQKKSADAQTAYLQDGNKLLRWQKDIGRGWRQLKEDVVGWFEVPTSEKLQAEQMQLNYLAQRLTDSNLKEDERRKIINQINGIAPELLKGLDLENISNEDLAKNLKAVNEQYLNRIILQQKEEELQKAGQKAAKAKAKSDELRINIGKGLSAIAIELNAEEEILGKNLSEQYQILTKINKESGNRRTTSGLRDLQEATKVYELLLDRTNNKTEKAIDLEKERNALAEEYGINLNTSAATENEVVDPSPTTTPSKPKALKRNITIIDEADLQSDIDAVIAAEDQKFQEIIETAKGYSDEYREEVNEAYEQWQADELAKQEAFEEQKHQLLMQYQLYSQEELMQMELDNLQEAYDKKLLNEEQFQQAKQNIIEGYETENKLKRIQEVQEYYAASEALASSFLTFYTGKQDAELNKLKSTYDKKIKAAGNNTAKVAQLEEELATKQKAIEKKKATAEMIMNIAKITANTALAISKSVAQSPVTFGLPWSAFAAATGAIQIATAIQQRNAIAQAAQGRYPVTGADDGRTYNATYSGPVTRSGIYGGGRPTLINEHGPEMILTAPHTRRLQLNPDLYNQVMRLRYPQRADGNYPAQPAPAGGTQATDQMLATMQAMNNTIARLDQRLANLYAKIVWDDVKEAEATITDIEDFAAGGR